MTVGMGIHMPVVKKAVAIAPATPKANHNSARFADAKNLAEQLAKMTIEQVPIDAIKPSGRRTKKHTDQKISLLTGSIETFGHIAPIIVDEHGVIVAGHARYEAARRSGLQHAPVIRLTHLSETERRALALADNKLSDLGEWDAAVLKQEIEFFFDPMLDLSFDPSIIGFDTVDIDQILAPDAGANRVDPLDAIEPPDDTLAAVTRLGDMWTCEAHRLVCGDARDEAAYVPLMAGGRADMVFTDVPYNVPNTGHVTKREGVREFAMAAGEMNSDEFIAFLSAANNNIATFTMPGAVIYHCMDWRHLRELHVSAEPMFGGPKNLIVWVKTNAGLGSFYRSQHETISVFVKPGGKHTNNFGLGARGRYRTNVWTYPGFNSFGRGRDEALAMHPTVKPVAMVTDAIKDCSKRGDIVLDPFAGSGTMLIAAERTKRSARLIELDSLYCDLIAQRWHRLTGKSAILNETGETFAQVKERRGGEPRTEGAQS